MKSILIFSGYNMRAILAFVRTLEMHKLHYAVIASSADDPIFKTAYGSKVAAIRPTSRLDIDSMMDLLADIARQLKARRYLIAPSTEALNRFILRHREDMRSLKIDIPLTDESRYLAISDKASFQALCDDAKIDTPVSFASIDDAPLPFVAKPRMYISPVSGEALHPVFIHCQDDINNFKTRFCESDFYYQEYVDGNSYYFLFYFFKDNRKPLIFSQENLIQQKDGGSILAAVSSNMQCSSIAQQYEKLFVTLGFWGLVMVEVRGTKTAAKMIEANPRFWGPSQLFVDANVNFFEAMLTDSGFNLSARKMPSQKRPTKYFWDDGYSFNDDHIQKIAFHNYSENRLRKSYDCWDQNNLFKRSDTLDLYADFVKNSEMARSSKLARLRQQYGRTSKHSNYQILPPQLESLIPNGELATRSRHEKERFEFINNSIKLRGKSVLDIGGNTGYFTFEALRAGAHVTYYEGNESHADFVTTASEILNTNDDLLIKKRYYLFDDPNQNRYDVVFLMNVLHHVGDDYGDGDISKHDALNSVIESLTFLSKLTDTLVFQLGFNWKGDTKQPLFQSGTKIEMIDFLKTGLQDVYHFEQIAVADRIDGRTVYVPVNEENIKRRDDLGEFLNRPLIIMRTKKQLAD